MIESKGIAPSRITAERHWALAAAIAATAVFGLSVGEGIPLLSLVLEAHGTRAALNGLNAAATFIGVIVGPLIAQRAVRAVGMRNFLLICIALDVAATGALKVFEGIGAWFVLRALLGMIGSSLFTAAESWINLLASDAGRGRVIGLYAVGLSAGFGVGPLILSLTGIRGWSPFIANMAISAAAALPLLGVGNLGRDLGRERGGSPFAMFARAPLIVLAVAIFGLYETALMALLPIWGVRGGISASMAAATLSAVYIGSIALQLPVGWLSDKLARLDVLRLCAAIGLVGAALVTAKALSPAAQFALLFVWGGIAAGIYPVALGMAGDRFQAGELVAVNAAMIIAYGLGGLAGPALGGAALDLWTPRGLPALFAVLFAALLLASALLPKDALRLPALRRREDP
jgi:MFS family permease